MSWNWIDCHKMLTVNLQRKLANNTYLVECGTDEHGQPVYGIKLYNTVVVEHHHDGTVRLFSGGYRTKTTKDRMNLFSPMRVWQRNFKWVVSAPVCPSRPVPMSEVGVSIGEGGHPRNNMVDFEDGISWNSTDRRFFNPDEA